MRATIKLHRYVLEEIVSHANRNPELECCGFLIGSKSVKDDEIIIDINAIYHDYKVGGLDHCTFSFITQNYAECYAKQLNNGSKVIGNYHSHGTYPAIFSPVDRAMQLEWTNNNCTLIYSPKYNSLIGEVITRNKEAIPARITLYGQRVLNDAPVTLQSKNEGPTTRL